MSWRRRKQHKPRVELPAPSDVPGRAASGAPEIPAALRSLVQEAVDLAKRELSDTGRIMPKALFVYDKVSPDSRPKNIAVALSCRSEPQQDALRRRIREKALQEGARAVVVAHGNTPGILTISGITDDMRIAASVNYSFDKNTKTVNRWEVRWRAEPDDEIPF